MDPETGEFKDEHGRARIFHGFNSVIKHHPWYDPKMLNPDRQRQIADLGFNIIRLGSMWTGVEPEEGNVNATYIDTLDVSSFSHTISFIDSFKCPLTKN